MAIFISQTTGKNSVENIHQDNWTKLMKSFSFERILIAFDNVHLCSMQMSFIHPYSHEFFQTQSFLSRNPTKCHLPLGEIYSLTET
jgi:hypothetical protein